MSVELDFCEYSSDALAQAAYVTSDAGGIYVQQTGNTDVCGLGDYHDTEYWTAQSFTLSGSETISKVKITFGAGVGSPAGNVTLRIETDDTDLPSGTLAHANASKAITPVASSENTFDFANDFGLTADTYWLVLCCDNQAYDVRWFIGMDSDTTMGAIANSTDGGSSWSAYATYNLTCKVYTVHTQSYSESTIKTQGSYSLKGIAAATDSLNDTLTRTIGSPIDLSDQDLIKMDIRASRTGSNIKIGFHDSGGVTTEHTANIASANQFQTENIDISAVANADKDAIDEIKITITNADA